MSNLDYMLDYYKYSKNYDIACILERTIYPTPDNKKSLNWWTDKPIIPLKHDSKCGFNRKILKKIYKSLNCNDVQTNLIWLDIKKYCIDKYNITTLKDYETIIDNCSDLVAEHGDEYYQDFGDNIMSEFEIAYEEVVFIFAYVIEYDRSYFKDLETFKYTVNDFKSLITFKIGGLQYYRLSCLLNIYTIVPEIVIKHIKSYIY